MNYAKWERETNLTTLGLKLAEEAGEVCKEVNSPMPLTVPERARLLKELDHVDFIADRMREVVNAPVAEGG